MDKKRSTPPAPVVGKQLIDSQALADKLGLVDVGMITKLIQEEGLPVHYLTRKLRRFDVAEVDRWIDSRWSNREPGQVA